MPSTRNVRWSLDFVLDALGDGRRTPILAVVNDYTRDCVALVFGTSLSGARVARELDGLVMLRGRPTTIVSDNGTALTSHALLRWQLETGIAWHYFQPGKPQQDGFIDSFDGRLGTNFSTRRCSGT